MRFLPFAKGKNGFQFAGGGVTSDSGGGGGGGGSELGTVTTLTGTLNSAGEHTIKQNVTSYDWVIGYVKASYSGDSDYWLPIGYLEGSDRVNARLQGTNFKLLFTSSGATNISYKLFVGNLVTSE